MWGFCNLFQGTGQGDLPVFAACPDSCSFKYPICPIELKVPCFGVAFPEPHQPPLGCSDPGSLAEEAVCLPAVGRFGNCVFLILSLQLPLPVMMFILNPETLKYTRSRGWWGI